MTPTDAARSALATGPPDPPAVRAEGSTGRRRGVVTPVGGTLVLVGIALVLWGVSLPQVDLGRIDGWGLLPGLPVLWYVAYALVLIAVVTSFSSRRGRPYVDRIAALAALMVLLFATTSLVYDAPRFPWTYKHIGVADYLLLHHRPALDLDIYQNFPGFFYLAALVHVVTRVPVFDLARWAELFFTAANAACAYWALGALTRSTRVRGVAVLLFTLTNWIGQAYFSPQSLAFPLSLVLLGIFLRWVSTEPGAVTAWLPRTRTAVDPDATAPRHRRRRSVPWLLLFYAVYAVVVVTHQLSPVATFLQVVAATVLVRFRGVRLLPGLALIEVLWLWHAYPFINSHYVLFGDANADNIRPPTFALTAVLPGAGVIAQVPHLITVVIAVSTVAAVVVIARREHSIRSSLIPLALAAAPISFLIVQPYGQEGILRVYLYALPWICFLVAKAFVGPGHGNARVGVRIAVAAVLSFLGVVALPETFGFEIVNRVVATDVAAENWFDVSTPPHAVLIHLVPAFPDRGSAHYDAHYVTDDPDGPVLVYDAAFATAARTAPGLESYVAAYLSRQPTTPVRYLGLGPTQTNYMLLYGLTTPPTYRAFVARLEADPRFTVAYRNGDSLILRYRGGATG